MQLSELPGDKIDTRILDFTKIIRKMDTKSNTNTRVVHVKDQERNRWRNKKRVVSKTIINGEQKCNANHRVLHII